jgi:hypothetical protein
MDAKDLIGQVEFTRRELADRIASLAERLNRTADAVRRASTLKELSLGFNPLGEIQNACEVNSLCGRLGAYIRVLEKVAPATTLGKRT